MSTALNLKPSPAPDTARVLGAEDETDVSALIARLTGEVNQIACE